MKKGQTLPPKQRHSLDIKGLPDALLGSRIAEGLIKKSPDLFILGGGFFLGYVMNMRPGLTIPTPLGNIFIGFPDFGGKIDSLRRDAEILKKKVEGRDAILARRLENAQKALEACAQHCFELRRAGVEPERCMERCQEAFERTTEGFEAERVKFVEELRIVEGSFAQHRVAQGLLMSLMSYAFTRPGFIQGIGEIIPG